MKGPSGSNYGSFGYVVVGAVVLIAFFRYIHGFVSQPRLNHAAINAVMDKCEPSSVPARAKVGGRDIFVLPHCQPQGLLVLLHGCTRFAASFFYSPEGREIVKQSQLDGGFAILAVSKEKELGCWNPEEEVEVVKQVIQQTKEKYGWQKLPLYGFGASSGGSMLGALSQAMGFCAINIQISPVKKNPRASGVIYTLMENDSAMLKFSKLMRPELEASGNVQYVRVLQVKTPTVREDFFAKKIEGVSIETSKLFFKTLVSEGFVDMNAQVLKKNPRQSNPLEKFQPSHPFFLEPGISKLLTHAETKDAAAVPIIEELNVLYNQHEITSALYLSHVLPFFKAQNCAAAVRNPKLLKSQIIMHRQFNHP